MANDWCVTKPRSLLGTLLVCWSLAAIACGPDGKTAKPTPDELHAAGAALAATPATPILVGVGDIASCDDLAGARATARLLDAIPGTVFTVGDNAYPDGSARDFADCYGPTWGRHKLRTRPSPGNHEFHSGQATPYFQYFGSAAGDPKVGYYSFELARWQIISLNSNCADLPGGCSEASPQLQWLRKDLADHPATCTVAYFHHPLFSSGREHGNDAEMRPFWQALYDGNADLVINGHDHDYERFAPQDPNGHKDGLLGIREFVVGTGGKNSHREFAAIQPNSEAHQADTFGLLKLTLHPTSYDWELVPEAGKTFHDSGTSPCH